MSAQPFVMTHAGGQRTVASYTIPKYTVSFARRPERSAGASRTVRVWGDGGALPSPLEVTLHVSAQDDQFVRLSEDGTYGAMHTSGATAASQPVTEFDLRMRVRFSVLRNEFQYLLRKQGAYAFYVDGNGRVGFTFGARSVSPAFRPTLPETLAGTPVWLRVTVETTAFSYLATFWSSSDGEAWVPLLAPAWAEPGGNMASSTSDVVIGESNVMLDVFRMHMRTAIDGPITMRFDADDMPPGAAGYYSSTGEYWTRSFSTAVVVPAGLGDAYATAYAIAAEAESATLLRTHMGDQHIAGLLGFRMLPVGADVLLSLRFAPQFERAYFSLVLASQSATAEVVPGSGTSEYVVTYAAEDVTHDAEEVLFSAWTGEPMVHVVVAGGDAVVAGAHAVVATAGGG